MISKTSIEKYNTILIFIFPGEQGILLHFDEFKLEGSGCIYDYVTVNDGKLW